MDFLSIYEQWFFMSRKTDETLMQTLEASYLQTWRDGSTEDKYAVLDSVYENE
jgi:hypothetical protein